ncbi:MAG: hypothetical protein ACREK8_05750 [Gemmatimonadales bacterium]
MRGDSSFAWRFPPAWYAAIVASLQIVGNQRREAIDHPEFRGSGCLDDGAAVDGRLRASGRF